MSKRVEAANYQGYHTHPSQDSTAKVLADGSVLVTHRIDLRQGYVITAINRLGGSATVKETKDRLNKTFPKGGYNENHVRHALMRLRELGIVKCKGKVWSLTDDARNKFNSVEKNVVMP